MTTKRSRCWAACAVLLFGGGCTTTQRSETRCPAPREVTLQAVGGEGVVRKRLVPVAADSACRSALRSGDVSAGRPAGK